MENVHFAFLDYKMFHFFFFSIFKRFRRGQSQQVKKVKKLKIVKIEYSPLINKQVELVPLLYINFLDNENFVRHFLLDNL